MSTLKFQNHYHKEDEIEIPKNVYHVNKKRLKFYFKDSNVEISHASKLTQLRVSTIENKYANACMYACIYLFV